MSGMENAHALVICIADYWYPNRYFGTLPPTVCKDARDIHALLVHPWRGGYLAENAQPQLNDPATLAGLRGAPVDLAVRCDTGSVAFPHISSAAAAGLRASGTHRCRP